MRRDSFSHSLAMQTDLRIIMAALRIVMAVTVIIINSNIYNSPSACYVLGAKNFTYNTTCQHIIVARQDWASNRFHGLPGTHLLLEGDVKDPLHLFTWVVV